MQKSGLVLLVLTSQQVTKQYPHRDPTSLLCKLDAELSANA